MSFGKINKIIKFIDKFVKTNSLDNLFENQFLDVANKIIKEGKPLFPEITVDLILDILSKKYTKKYIFKETINFENGKNCFPEFTSFYPEVEIPAEYQKLEDQFQKLKGLPQPEQRTPAWFAYRHNRITASDTAAAIDENPYEPVESFILKKCDPTHKFLDNANVYHGKKYELIATKIYEHIYNNQIFEFGALPSDHYEFLGASPDGICSCKTLDNNFSPRVGTMLEIKCVAPHGRKIETSGDIPGHICPYYYYLQVQQQLECCELEVCDFWQCKLIEYKTREAFLFDKCLYTEHTVGTNAKKIEIDSKIKKGMLLQFFPREWEPEFDEDNREWKSKFIYPPRLDLTEKEYDDWFVKVMNNLQTEHEEINKTHYFHKIIYWKLEQSHNQPIQRDRKLFTNILPKMIDTWKKVEYYRENLDKLDELKIIVEQRKKFIKVNTDFNINTDIIKNEVLFLDTPNLIKSKTSAPKKNIKSNIDPEFNVDFIDDVDTNKPIEKVVKVIKPKKKVINKKEESDKEDDNNYKKTESSFKKTEYNFKKVVVDNIDFID